MHCMSVYTAQLRRKWHYIIIVFFFIYIMEYMGVMKHLAELDYATQYQYPMVGDVKQYVQQMRKRLEPDVQPINVYNQTFLIAAEHKCQTEEKIRLVYLVKSAAANSQMRAAIRRTWGFEKRFSDVQIRTVFFVGVTLDPLLASALVKESNTYNDIVQLDFIDSYFNNTIKTMNEMRWAIFFCPNASFYFFSDDDMYISTKNVLRFTRNPVEYPKYLEAPLTDTAMRNPKKWPSNIYHLELPADAVLYAGKVMNKSPLRNKNSKWYITLDEYPYDRWPPYVPAGCYILSREALFLMYYTSLYTKHFRFDDIFLSFVALKAGVEPFHSEEFYLFSRPTDMGYKYAIAVHDIKIPEELIELWERQRSWGNC